MKPCDFVEEKQDSVPKILQFPQRPAPTMTIRDEAGTHAFYLYDPGTGHVLKRYMKVDDHLGAVED